MAVSETKQQASSWDVFLGMETDGVEGFQGEQHSGVLEEGGREGTSSCPISPNLLFSGGGRRVEQQQQH